MHHWTTGREIKRMYKDARNIRFSCAYLFRIKIGDEYFLVKDEQGRETFQPVGGVYKYTDDSFLVDLKAVQCTRFGTNSDLDSDLRIVVPRENVKRFERWYRSEEGRETPENLYREFQEEVIDRIDALDYEAFETITYCYCGEHIEASRWGERNVQIHIAEVVELIPTARQTAAFQALKDHESTLYRFATKDEIYENGRTKGNQVMSISPHTVKVLEEEESKLHRNKHSKKIYSCSRSEEEARKARCDWKGFVKVNPDNPFTFVSYQSDHSSTVWDFCHKNRPPLENLWIDKKQVGENWMHNVEKAFSTGKCEKALLFVTLRYLNRSSACYKEASLVVEHQVPHIVILVDIDQKGVKDTIQSWIVNDGADKEKLRTFKKIFHYNDDTGHLDGTFFSIPGTDIDWFLQVYENLGKTAEEMSDQTGLYPPAQVFCNKSIG